jgi:hypothetical protein
LAGRKAPHRRARPLGATLLPLIVALSSSAALDAESALRADLLVGFNGVLRPGRRAPLIVDLENTGAEVAARIEVDVSMASGLGGAAVSQRIVRSVTLAKGVSRRERFTVAVPFNPRLLAVRILGEEPSRGGPAAASSGAELVRREVDLRDLVTGDRIFLAVSSDLAFDSLGALAGSGQQARVVYPHAQNLPDVWSAYDGVDAVIVRDTASQRLKAAQVSALERWVFSGGTLVFTGGLPALMLAGSGLDGLLPVEVGGLVEAEGLHSLAAFLGASRAPAGRIALAGARVRAGDVLVEQDGIPLVVRRGLGAGWIWFFAFDCAMPPLASWEGMGSLWRAVAAREPLSGQGEGSRPLADDPWMKPLLESPSFSFPPSLAVLAFAGCFVLLFLPLTVRKISARIRAPLRVVIFVAGPVLASAAGFLLFNRVLFDARDLLAVVATIECASGDGLGLVTEKVGVLSAEGGRYEVSFRGRGAAVEESSGAPFTLDESSARDGTAVITGTAGRRFAGALFTLSSVIEFPLSGRFVEQGGALSLTVSNQTDLAVTDAVLVSGGLQYPVGAIPPGATEERTFSRGDGIRLSGVGGPATLAVDPLFAKLWAQALTAADREKPLLVARLPASPLGVRALRGGLHVGGLRGEGSRRYSPLAAVVLELR